MSAPSSPPDRLEAALVHVSTIYGLYIGQRQNLVNYYLVAIGFLAAAYAATVDKQRPVAVVVAAIGVLASVGAYLQDRRLKDLMKAAERPLKHLQQRLATELHIASLEIQATVESPDALKQLVDGQAGLSALERGVAT